MKQKPATKNTTFKKTPAPNADPSNTIKKIWVNEQVDPSGIIHACIATCNEAQAQDCHESFEQNLTSQQKDMGWVANLRIVQSWDEVPVNALKLD